VGDFEVAHTVSCGRFNYNLLRTLKNKAVIGLQLINLKTINGIAINNGFLFKVSFANCLQVTG